MIVCTRNRGSRLLDFLTRVSHLEAPPGGWELILVDNASTDSTPVVLDEFARSASAPVRCVLAPAAGLARARNVGIAASSGDLLAFTDDDCYSAREYLCVLVEIFEEYNPGFVGGLAVLHDPTDASTLSSRRTPLEIRPRSFLPAGTIHGASMAVSREVVRAIGGFDPTLAPVHGVSQGRTWSTSHAPPGRVGPAATILGSSSLITMAVSRGKTLFASPAGTTTVEVPTT